ncbi:hypothetical protein C7974DRAFT_389063 [Boeremia exigua]|uniref:uncharacterized protein n=1 Tax=Boeremia exigua TaxID=749465 RepID=UPI001E8DF246|nr:uncharacterized protein C7974DRAFT_389063 [Boeremia exigua]KAH6639722.1 hypothetical protein C7974DRAFT_389063 [Boeremia exigua]
MHPVTAPLSYLALCCVALRHDVRLVKAATRSALRGSGTTRLGALACGDMVRERTCGVRRVMCMRSVGGDRIRGKHDWQMMRGLRG